MSYNDNNPQLKESIRKSWRREMCASKVKKELWFKTLKHFCSQDECFSAQGDWMIIIVEQQNVKWC